MIRYMTHHSLHNERLLRLALFNFEDGGLVRNLFKDTSPGKALFRDEATDPAIQFANGYDLGRLLRAVQPLAPPTPHIIVLNEAKQYAYAGGRAGNRVANVLGRQFGRPYVFRAGHSDRGDYGPALFYDARYLCLDVFGDLHPSVPENNRNVAYFSVRDDPQTRFRVAMQHWDFASGDRRLEEAKLIAHTAKPHEPTFLLGDLNSTASGPHLPQADFEVAPISERRNKGRLLHGENDTRWMVDTRAVDYLIGTYTGDGEAGMGRVNGMGFRSVAEISHELGMPAEQAFRATVNDGIDAAGGLLIDWALVNEPLVDRIEPGSYHVHVPEGSQRSDYPSDHRWVQFEARVPRTLRG
jgi:hypothetical protein